MKSRFFRFCFAAILLISLTVGRNLCAAIDSGVDGQEHGFVFSLEKSGKRSYLVGTIHSGMSEEQNLGSLLVSLAAGAKRIYVEADIRDDAGVRAIMLEGGLRQKKASLEETIGDTYFRFFRSLLVDRYQILSAEQYKSARPWYIAMLIPIADGAKEPSWSFGFGTEAQLFKIADSRKIPVAELEGLRSQIEIFNLIDPSMEARYFSDYVDLIQDRTIYRWQIEEIKAWTSGDFSRFGAVLKAIAGHQTPYTTFYYERLIKDRNVPLASKIAGIAAKYDNQLFAVGSEHLVGPESVLDALRADGFTVSRLHSKARGQN